MLQSTLHLTEPGCPTQATRRAVLRQALGGAVALAGAQVASAAELGRSLVVVYPELGEPFRQVFTTIIEGIEDKLGGAVTSFAVANNANPAQVAEDVRRRDAKVLIGLGRGGMRWMSWGCRPVVGSSKT